MQQTEISVALNFEYDTPTFMGRIMHRALSSRWLSTALRTAEQPATLGIPLYLCPAVSERRLGYKYTRTSSSPWQASRRRFHVQPADSAETTTASSEPAAPAPAPELKPVRKLPAQCTGCGAFSQTSFPDQPGFFDLDRKAIRRYLGIEKPRERRVRLEEEFFKTRLKELKPEELEHLGLDMEDMEDMEGAAIPLDWRPEITRTVPRLNESKQVIDRVLVPEKALKKPICERCHRLVHHSSGESIYHPTIDSIKDTIAESPYKYNHVYHILDAADFPMSLLPKLHHLLDLMPLRTQNRRSRAGKFYHGQKNEMSFIITRADLLAPQKEQVDRLLPYLREVLRDALGRVGSNVRLGNVRCVSAKNSWWTKDLKEEIWKRGGAGWMVGKVNVGKSQLFEAVFPKGRMDWDPTRHQITIGMTPTEDAGNAAEVEPVDKGQEEGTGERAFVEKLDEEALDEFSLLPPAPPETQYPEMPLVSDLPGTTASPIRVPYGNGRGELIDLPGVERTGLDKYVKAEHRKELIIRSRVVPEQQVLKPGRSLLVGGFIRLTPREPAPVILGYAFTPRALEPHVTRTDKAVEIQAQTSQLNVDSVAVSGTGEKTRLAQSVELKWDVTKERAGPITRKDAVGLQVNRLPYRVLAADILIEGMGWVEVVAQVRTKDLYSPRRIYNASPTTETTTEPKPEPEKTLSALERLEALVEDPTKRRKPVITTPPPEPEVRESNEPNWPIVDVYTPEGKFIGVRRPMNGWLLNKPRVTAASRRQRPRKSFRHT